MRCSSLLAAGTLLEGILGTRTKPICILAIGVALAFAAKGVFRAPEVKAGLDNARTVTEVAATGTLPRKIGECVQTTVTSVGTRLKDTPGSGSFINFANGEMEVSYDTIPGIEHSKSGDPIRLCLIEIPRGCPPGDDRGRTYTATNLCTGDSWTEGNSSHTCGGA